jgi:glycerol-3-phosphate dehydrogenase
MGDAAAFIPDAERKRMLFVIPWLDAVIVGTTDTSFEGDIDKPFVEESDRNYCLDAVNSVFHLGLNATDISGAWAGLRPLIAGKAGSTADLSRNHSIYDIAPGIRGITGGKLTTYRRMAKDVVDLVADDLGNNVKCKTGWIRLGTTDVGALAAAVERRGQKLHIPPASVANLVRCYGDRSLAVMDIADAAGLASPLVTDMQPIAAEAVYVSRHEMAVHLSDLLARRTRLALTDRAAGVGPDGNATSLMGAELGWNTERSESEEQAHVSEIEMERGMPLGPHIHSVAAEGDAHLG